MAAWWWMILCAVGYVLAGPFAIVFARTIAPNLVFFSPRDLVAAVLCWPWVLFSTLTGRLTPRDF